MLSPLRNRFGIPGVISVIALVFAMLGGAYAANSSGGGKATASAKGKQGPRGKTGKTGPAGPAGPQGPAGANGKDGANGSNGSNGNDGAPGAAGAPGTSVTNTKLNAGNVKCPEGGAEFKVGSGTATFACNGEEGAEGQPGPEGSPWTAGGTLPPGATETGNWAFSVFNAAEEENPTIFAPISFPIPAGPDMFTAEEHAQFQGEAEFSTHCHGFPVEPSAPPGELCVYNNTGSGTGLKNATFTAIGNGASSFTSTPSSTGAVLRFAFSGEPGEGAFGFGTWAMTGCSASLPEGDPSKCP